MCVVSVLRIVFPLSSKRHDTLSAMDLPLHEGLGLSVRLKCPDLSPALQQRVVLEHPGLTRLGPPLDRLEPKPGRVLVGLDARPGVRRRERYGCENPHVSSP